MRTAALILSIITWMRMVCSKAGIVQADLKCCMMAVSDYMKNGTGHLAEKEAANRLLKNLNNLILYINELIISNRYCKNGLNNFS